MMNRLKAAAFDLDDTLLRNDLSVSSRTVSIFRRLRDSCFLLIAASGRAQLSMKPFLDQLDCICLYIACNGAEIYDGASHALLHSESFSADLAREIASFGEEYGCYMQTYAGGCFYFNQYGEYADRYAAASRLKGVFVGNLRSFIREPRSKILMMDDEQKIARMLEDARKHFDGRLSVTCSKPYFLEFNPLRATKGIALAFAAQRLGIQTDEIVVFGDSLNDLSMLQAAGHAVAVANGRRDVQVLCDEVCGSNDEDGVACWLAEHFLTGEVLS